ncbi:MAG: hypothetical protein DMF87_00780 [Acidobacteria bacterium]|nr:MAG: hypothetical protein DMF87_00780 [Acidobacteriota bacterium]
MNCLDAETLAAWMDGGLTGAALEDVRGHVAGCQRCQMLLGAMGRTRAAVPASEPERAPRWWLAWAVPLAAAATALAIWVAVPRPSGGPPAPGVPAVSAPGSDAVVLDNAPSRDLKQAPASAAPGSANALAERVQIAPLCGAVWTAAMPAAATELVAGSSPAQGICWVVGRGGTVWRSVDGRAWQRVTFPEMTDLSAVQAADARSATVMTADGRSFATDDGGLTWTRR